MLVSIIPLSSVAGTSTMLPKGNDTCRLRYGAPIWPRRRMMATGPPTRLLEVPSGSPIATATVPEKTFEPLSSGELLAASHPGCVNPGMPPNEMKPRNWFVVGSSVEWITPPAIKDSLVLIKRPSEPMFVLTTVEMGTPRCAWKL